MTIKDIAKLSGYSTATVSLALSGKSTRITEAVCKEIQQIAREHHYIPNSFAAGLSQKGQKNIGFMITNLDNPHIAQAFTIICNCLEREDFMLFGSYSEEQPPAERLRKLLSMQISLLICEMAELVEPDEEVAAFWALVEQADIPVIGFYSSMNVPQSAGGNVTVDFFKGGYLATRHLLQLGHRKIGCITGNPEYVISKDRLNGYKAALEEASIHFNADYIYEGDFTFEAGSNALPSLLGHGITAIFAFNDMMAYGAYTRCRAYGLRIPEDISIIGFDDLNTNEILDPPLTSVHIPVVGIAEKIVEYVKASLDKQPIEPKMYVYEPKLMIRGSTNMQTVFEGPGMPVKIQQQG